MANRLSRRGRQTLLVLHYVSSVGWLGVGLCQLTLNVVALTTGDPALRHAAHEFAHILDRSVLTFLAVGAAVTGILLAVRGKWGLFKHRWIVVKLVVNVALIIATPIWVGSWIGQAIKATAGETPATGYPRGELMGSSVVIVSTLLIVTVISVVKPWGRRRPTRPAPSPRASLPAVNSR
ncbi:M48 family metalloprotease [Sphaerisporangium corydalis]|uniref:DUF2269 domain-containing protein n=1 Tax=Sphaerisporangium corydalis TaxID=1441875 RepID=A0ABV9ET18_9ACTN|nr:hypothetical protein [Sphaerisporangium corydalis]